MKKWKRPRWYRKKLRTINAKRNASGLTRNFSFSCSGPAPG